MKRAAVFTFVVCWAVSALSLAEVGINPIPAATVSHPHEFGDRTPPPTTTNKTTITPTTTNTTTTTPITTNTTTITPTTNSTTTTTKPTTTKKPITTTTTKKPITTTTTKKPITTTTTKKPIITTTTKKPIITTTTNKPTTTPTTTNKPTTTPITTIKTTTTTTTPAPPKPTPPPTDLTVGNYSLTDKSGVFLRAQMAVLIRLATPKANGTFIVQPKLTKAIGICSAKYATLNLTFTQGFIYFRFNKSAAEVFVDELSFSLYYPLAKDDKTTYTASNKSLRLFPAKIGHSYSCKNQSIDLGKGLFLEVNQDRMQAYNLTKSSEFGLPDPCAADKSDYRVAIAVGVTLLILIIIVVVAYLLGRRRKTGGYQPL